MENIKNEKGVTLISVTIYIIVLTLTIAIMSVLGTYFVKNIKEADTIDPIAEFTKFNSFFTDEINHKNIQIVEYNKKEEGIERIIFNNGTQYTFIKKNKSIYRNEAKICRNIEKCEFKVIKRENKKDKIEVSLESEGKKKKMTFRLK